MLTAMLVAENILGGNHDVWNVNVERSYHEEFQVADKKKQQTEAAPVTGAAAAAVTGAFVAVSEVSDRVRDIASLPI